MRSSRAVLIASCGFAAVIALSACGSSAAGQAQALAGSIEQVVAAASEQLRSVESAAAEAAPGADAPAGANTEPTADASTPPDEPPVTRQVNKTGWHGGFSVTVDAATATPGFGANADVTIELTYGNLGTAPADAPQPTVVIGDEVAESFDDVPAVPGGGSAGGSTTVTAGRDDGADQPTLDEVLDTVSLVFGDAGDNQTVIPLSTAAVQSVEPKTLTATGTLRHDQILVDVAGGSLVPSYETGEAGTMLLNLQIALTCDTNCSAYGYYVDRSDFSITGPDGSSVLPEQRSGFCCEAVYPGTVSTSAQNVLTFALPAPATGDFVLTFNNPTAAATGAAAATLPFTA